MSIFRDLNCFPKCLHGNGPKESYPSKDSAVANASSSVLFHSIQVTNATTNNIISTSTTSDMSKTVKKCRECAIDLRGQAQKFAKENNSEIAVMYYSRAYNMNKDQGFRGSIRTDLAAVLKNFELEDDDNVLHHFVRKGNPDEIKCLLCIFPDLISRTNAKNKLPLHLAVSASNETVVQILLKHSSLECIISLDTRSKTPLHLAIEKSNQNIIKTVLSFINDKQSAQHENEDKRIEVFNLIKQDEKISEIFFSMKGLAQVYMQSYMIDFYKNRYSKKMSNYVNCFDVNKLTFGALPYKTQVSGNAGIGKTYLSNYIVSEWAALKLWKQKFDVIFKIDLLNLLRRSRLPLTLAEIISESFADVIGGPLRIKDVQSMLNAFAIEKMLFIFDDYDVIPKNIKWKETIDDILKNEKTNCIVLGLNLKLERYYRSEQLDGFSNKQIQEYVTKEGLKKKDEIIQFLKKHSEHMCVHTPLFLKIICQKWDEGMKFNNSFTVLIDEVRAVYSDKLQMTLSRQKACETSERVNKVTQELAKNNHSDLFFLTKLIRAAWNIEFSPIDEYLIDVLRLGFIYINQQNLCFIHPEIRRLLWQ